MGAGNNHPGWGGCTRATEHGDRERGAVSGAPRLDFFLFPSFSCPSLPFLCCRPGQKQPNPKQPAPWVRCCSLYSARRTSCLCIHRQCLEAQHPLPCAAQGLSAPVPALGGIQEEMEWVFAFIVWGCRGWSQGKGGSRGCSAWAQRVPACLALNLPDGSPPPRWVLLPWMVFAKGVLGASPAAAPIGHPEPGAPFPPFPVCGVGKGALGVPPAHCRAGLWSPVPLHTPGDVALTAASLVLPVPARL